MCPPLVAQISSLATHKGGETKFVRIFKRIIRDVAQLTSQSKIKFPRNQLPTFSQMCLDPRLATLKSMQQSWILGSAQKDISFMVVPGFVILAISTFAPEHIVASSLYALLAVGLAESGHVYTTAWRTYFNRDELKSSKLYLWVPLIIFVGFTSWMLMGRKGLWSFVAYANLFHHIRQYYGFTRWYGKLNGTPDRWSGWFVQALCILPVLGYHFRGDAPTSYYATNDMLVYPNLSLVMFCFSAYMLTLFAWIGIEIQRAHKFGFEINRVISIATPALLYGLCFFFGKSLPALLFPLVVSHGFGYFGVMSEGLRKTQPIRFASFKKAALIVFATAVIGGGLEAYGELNWFDFDSDGKSPGLFMSIVMGLYTVPLFSHFFFDAVIWKKKHREAKLLFGAASVDNAGSSVENARRIS